MPILPQEPDLFPEDLLNSVSEEPNGTRWWGIYTRARREKDLMRRLRSLEIPHYGPMIVQRKRSPSGRMRTTHLPLFGNYVFLYGHEEQRRMALTTNCISRCLPVSDHGQLTRDLRQIHMLVESGAPLTPESRLEPGDAVRIRSGSLAGLEGVVIRRHGQDRLLVSVHFLQQGASLLLEDIAIEPLDSSC